MKRRSSQNFAVPKRGHRREQVIGKVAKVKLIVTLVVLAVMMVIDTYCIMSCMSYLNKYVVETEVGNVVNIDDYKPNFAGHDTSWIFKRDSDVIDWNKLGNYKVRYTPRFFGITQTLTIKVVDKTEPVITLDTIGENEYFESIDAAKARPYKAVDNYDGDITENVEVNYRIKDAGSYELIYTVSDSSGNEARVTQPVKIARGIIALTFDDGPSETITPQILDLLKEYGVKATFFVLNFEGREDIIRREYEEGHTIGFHGYSHDYSIYESVDKVLDNFKKIEEQVVETTGGESSKVIRFPGGSSNTVSRNYCEGVMSESVKAVEEAGYVYYDWNIDSDDAGSAKTKNEIVRNVIGGIMPGRLNVVLMHDAAGKEATLEALREILDYCSLREYVFVTLSTKTTPVHHGVSN